MSNLQYMPVKLHEWISANNPDDSLEYGKGWWDYVNLIQVIMHKFDLTDDNVMVVADYSMQTPPPSENILMPVILMQFSCFTILFKYDFGRFPEQWVVSVSHTKPIVIPTLNHFMYDIDNTINLDGLPKHCVFNKPNEAQYKFSAVLHDEWDFVTLLTLLVSNE